MSQRYLDIQLNAKVHEKHYEVDQRIISQLPVGAVVKRCRGHGSSNWGETARLDIEVDGEPKSYFLKLTEGRKGGPMLRGEFESLRMINNLIPNHCPSPLAWGQCADPNFHYLLLPFHELEKGPPAIGRMSQVVAQLHTRSVKENPTGKWGFHMTTYNGPLAQDNTWTDTWEQFWIRGMRRLFEFERAARGPSEELERLMKPYFEKVCPRLLRPLETKGRKIEPVLIHGDLWVGNMAVQAETGEPFIFDSSAFWGHNEYELSYMRPMDSDWGREYVEAYHRLIPKSEPQEDWEARNALYATRVVVVDSAIYPQHEHFRKILIDEMRKLVAQFPEGYVEDEHVRDANDSLPQ